MVPFAIVLGQWSRFHDSKHGHGGCALRWTTYEPVVRPFSSVSDLFFEPLSYPLAVPFILAKLKEKKRTNTI